MEDCGGVALSQSRRLCPSQQRVLSGSGELAADQELGDVMQRKNTKGRRWRQGELERTDDTCTAQGPVDTAGGAWECAVWERTGTSGALA